MMTKNTISYIVIAILLVLTSVISLNLFMRQRSEHDVLDMQAFPYKIGGWTGTDLEVTEKEYDILETKNLITREYVDGSGEKIHLFIIYSETNRSVFHPPEVCLIGSGVTIADKQSEGINFGQKEFLTNKLYLEKGDARSIALYCYKSGKLYTENFYLQQMHFMLNQLLGKRSGGATIRISMSVYESEEKTLATLKKFMKEAINKLEEI